MEVLQERVKIRRIRLQILQKHLGEIVIRRRNPNVGEAAGRDFHACRIDVVATDVFRNTIVFKTFADDGVVEERRIRIAFRDDVDGETLQ